MIKKELLKIREVLNWHPDYDIDKIIRHFKIRRNIIISLLILLLSVSVAFNFTTVYKNNKIDELSKNVHTLENDLWSNTTIKDSLFMVLESDGYFYDMIEDEARIKLPSNVDREHIEYMFERAIDTKIPIAIMFRLVHKESRFDSTAISSTGAFGYMQLLKSTYKRYCTKLNIDYYPITSKKNIYIGTEFLSEMYTYWYKKYPKSEPNIIWDYALATYNIGIANINDSTFARPDVSSYVNFIN